MWAKCLQRIWSVFWCYVAGRGWLQRGGQTEARNGVEPLQRFLNDFQRPTSQITETKTTDTRQGH